MLLHRPCLGGCCAVLIDFLCGGVVHVFLALFPFVKDVVVQRRSGGRTPYLL